MKAPGHRARRHHCNRRSRRHDALFPPFQGLWSRQRNTSRSLLRGKCPVATRSTRKRNTIRAQAQQSHPRQRLVRQGVSHSGRMPGARGPKIGSCGRPPRKWPSHVHSGFSGRSLRGSFPAGRRTTLGDGRGVDPRLPSRYAPLLGCLGRVGVQYIFATGLDCCDVPGFHALRRNWGEPCCAPTPCNPTPR